MQAIGRIKDDAAIANRYLADQLGAAEREAFEARLLQDPDVVRELEATARLKVGLQRLRETGELDRLVRAQPRPAQPFFLAMAASIAVLAIGLLVVRWQTTPSPALLSSSPAALFDQSGNALQVGSALMLMRARSATADAVIAAPPARVAIELRALPEVVSQSGVYQLDLSRLDGDDAAASIAKLDELRADAQGFVTAYVDSSLLQPGRYRLVISSQAPPSSTAFVINVLH